MEIIPHVNSSYHSLMTHTGYRDELNVLEKIHRYTHASSKEMKHLLSDANIHLSKNLSDVCHGVCRPCVVCVSSGRPVEMKKASLTHVNEAINEEFQVDFTIVYIENNKYEVLNIVDLGTSYGEHTIANNRSAITVKNII